MLTALKTIGHNLWMNPKMLPIINFQILSMEVFKQSSRVSIYLSTDGEVSTKELLNVMFKEKKEVNFLNLF